MNRIFELVTEPEVESFRLPLTVFDPRLKQIPVRVKELSDTQVRLGRVDVLGNELPGITLGVVETEGLEADGLLQPSEPSFNVSLHPGGCVVDVRSKASVFPSIDSSTRAVCRAVLEMLLRWAFPVILNYRPLLPVRLLKARPVECLVADLATCAMIQNHVDHTDDTKLLALFDRPLQLLLLGNVVPSPWQVPLRIGAGRGRRVPDDVEASSSEGRDVLVKKFVQLTPR
mmetsp:Transcript_798/g.1717  ORF Transcript_798/g.1717 Transcript_798/m.1717 type:complete len:229 (+) Transcript_798:656-1342(+)